MRILSNIPHQHHLECDVRCFDGAPACHSTHDPKKLVSLQTALKQQEPGWTPDFVMLHSPQNYPFPIDLYTCTVPIIMILDDWFGGIDFIPDVLAQADYIFTDRYSMALLNQMGFDNVGYWPCFGFNPDRFRLLPHETRSYDVTFCGSLNINIQQHRLALLRRVAGLDPQYRVKIFHAVWGEEYVRVLNQSRIVFNNSIKGEMNLRCFEAPACGALLFIEESNQEIRDFLSPGTECITYNKDNLETLLHRYLSNEDARSRIAAAGHARIQQFTYAALFSTLCSQLQALPPGRRTHSSRPTPHCAHPVHRDLMQISLSLRGRADDLLTITAELLAAKDNNPMPLNDYAVLLAAYLDDRRNTLTPNETTRILSIAEALLSKAISIRPGYLTARFNHGQILALQGNRAAAQREFELIAAFNDPVSYNSVKGSLYPVHYHSPFRYLWSTVLTHAIPNESAMGTQRLRVLIFFSNLLLAQLAAAAANPQESADRYTRAAQVFDNHTAALTPLLLSGNGTAQQWQCGLEKNPFNVALWKEYVRFLCKRGEIDTAATFIDNCVLCLSRMQFATPVLMSEMAQLRTAILHHKDS